jgi:plasmid stabilization system protein ParE
VTAFSARDNGYRLHPEVRNDLSAVSAYISHDNLDAANQVVRSISALIDDLIPLEVRYRGHRRHDLTDRPILFISVYDYLIAYAPDEIRC